ncbi:MAG: discoidin domain-containing protein, partial [Oscillospiraceae bacterium]|nr:discoidin domain-containing protein [Oscillospiraceae bacterium]
MKKRLWLKPVLVYLLTACLVMPSITGISPVTIPVSAALSFVPPADDAEAEWAQIQSVIGQYYGEANDTGYPGQFNNQIPDTALLGNGDLGVSSGGKSEEKTFYVSKSDFWTATGGNGAKPIPIGGVTIKPQLPEADPNLALKAPVIVSAETNDNGTIHYGANLVNGEDGNKWGAPSGSAPAGGHWAVIDLGKGAAVKKEIGRYTLKNAGMANENSHNTKAWKLQYLATDNIGAWTKTNIESIPAGNWIDIDEVTDNPANDDGKIVPRPIAPAVEARYVRLLVTDASNSASKDVRIHALEIYGPTQRRTGNIALNQPVKADSQNGSGEAAEMMVDGLDSTKWCATGAAPHWAIVDLGDLYDISKYVLKLAGYAGEDQHNAREWRFEYLRTGTAGTTPEAGDGAWATIGSLADNRWAQMDYVNNNPNTSAGRLYEKTFASTISARYVRIFFIQPAQPGNTAARVHELEIYSVDGGPNVNHAFSYKTVTASSTHESFTAARAVNDIPRTVGIEGTGYEGWVSQPGTGTQWLQLEFNDPVSIGYYTVKGDGYFRTNLPQNNPRAWKLQTSTNGTTWTDIDTVTANTLSECKRTLSSICTTKWIRLLIDDPLQLGSNEHGTGNARARIGQLELFREEPTGPPKPVPAFHEKQDILNAVVETEMTVNDIPLEMKTWTAANENYIITEIKSLSSAPGELSVQTWAAPYNTGSYPITAWTEGDTVSARRRTQTPPDNNSLEYNDGHGTLNGWISEAVLSTKVIGADDVSTDAKPSDGKAEIDFTIPAGGTVYVVTAVGGGGQNYLRSGVRQYNTLNGEAPKAWADRLLAGVAGTGDIGALRDDHAAWWKDYWTQSFINVNLGTSNADLNAIMKYYYAAQYMFGCASREGYIAPGLFAHWHTTDNPSWSGDMHLNYNFIATWYGAFSSNRASAALPAVEAITSFMPVAKKNSESITQLRRVAPGASQPAYTPNQGTNYIDYRIAKNNGITAAGGIKDGLLYPVGIGPWCVTADSGYHNEAVNGPFSAFPIIEYYNYTMDEEFLRDKAYEFLKGCAIFGMNWMEKQTDGKYRLLAGYNEGSWSLNPAVELAAYKYVIKNAIKASEILDVDPALRAQWQEVYDNMPAQPTVISSGNGVTNVLCYALAEMEYSGGSWKALSSPLPGDGNIIPLETVIPCDYLGYYSPAADLQIAQNTIKRFGNGVWSQMNNFPKAHPIAVRVRYPVSDFIASFANTIRNQMQPGNLRISDNNHGIEKVGATEAVNGMLLQADKGVAKVFPNWLANRSAEFKRLRAPGAFLISASYDGAAQKVNTPIKVESVAGQTFTIASPWTQGVTVIRDSDLAVMNTTISTAPNWATEVTFSFDTTAGETYWLIPYEAPSIEGYFTDNNGTDTPLVTTADVAYNTPGPNALAELSQAGYAKLSDSRYVPITIAWSFDSAYNGAVTGAKPVTGAVSGSFPPQVTPANRTGTINVNPEPITTAAISVTAPVPGSAPSAAATTTSSDFTVGTVTWTPTDNPFKYEQAYTATVTLTAAAGKTFAGITEGETVTINGEQATISGTPGTTLTISYEFAAAPLTPITTAAITVTAPAIGETPDDTAAGGSGYTLSSVLWT